jgi:hypothetical protein
MKVLIVVSVFFISIFCEAQENKSCGLFLNKTKSKLFTDSSKVVDRFHQPGGQLVVLRKVRVGLFHKLLIITLKPELVIKDFKALILQNEHDFWLQALIATQNIYFMDNNLFHRLFYGFRKSSLNLYKILQAFNVHFSMNMEDAQDLAWTTENSLQRHFAKHGQIEFGALDAFEYLEMAKKFLLRQRSSSSLLIRIRGNSYLKYDYISFEVAIVENNKITTYFRLTEDYRPQKEFDRFVAMILSEGLSQPYNKN